jgi:hypothetical protein
MTGSFLAGWVSPARGDLGFGTWAWPVVGPVIRGFEPPPTPYSAGHRGIDIAVPFGTPIRAPADGVVTFAGWVAGSLFVTVDHGDGVRSSYSWLSAVMVKKGDAVTKGEVLARTGHGHPDVDTPHLHFGVRINGEYVDPMLFLGSGSLVNVIHLAELTPPPSAVMSAERARVRTVDGMPPSGSAPVPNLAGPDPRLARPRGGGLVTLPPRGPPDFAF